MSHQDLLTLTYVSFAEPGIHEDAAFAIGEAAGNANAASGVTGLLLFNGLSFMQTLEGPRETVLHLFERIKRDPRHHTVRLIHCEGADRRAFAGFGMRMHVIEPPESGSSPVFADIIGDPNMLGATLLAFYQRFIVFGTALV